MNEKQAIKNNIDVVAYRSNGKESKKIEWFFIIFAIICLGLFAFAFYKTDFFKKGEMYHKILIIACGSLGLLNIIFSITNLFSVRRNNKNRQVCVGIAKDESVVLFNIKGKETKIKQNQLLDVKRSYFMSNNAIIVTYKLSTKKIEKVNIGWSEDIDAIKRLIITKKVKHEKKK